MSPPHPCLALFLSKLWRTSQLLANVYHLLATPTFKTCITRDQLASYCQYVHSIKDDTTPYKKLSWCWETRVTQCFMLTGSVPISYCFRDKRKFQWKMHLTPASKLPSRCMGNSAISYGTRHITHGTHECRRDAVRAAKYVQLLPFSTSLEPSFSDTLGSLNFFSVHSCRQNLPMISYMSA